MKKTIKRSKAAIGRRVAKKPQASTNKAFAEAIQRQIDEAFDRSNMEKDISRMMEIFNTVAADFKYVIAAPAGFKVLVVDPFGKTAFHDIAALRVDVLTTSGAPLIFIPRRGTLEDARSLDGFVGVFGPAETSTSTHRNFILKVLSKEIEEIIEAQRMRLSPTVRAHVFGPQKDSLEVYTEAGVKRIEEMSDEEYAEFREGLTDEECAFTDTARMSMKDLAPEPEPLGDAVAPEATQNAPTKAS